MTSVLADTTPAAERALSATPSLKLTLDGVTRRLLVPRSLLWSDLVAKIQRQFSVDQPLSLTYADDNGDEITLDTDEDLEELAARAGPGEAVAAAIRLHRPGNKPSCGASDQSQSGACTEREGAAALPAAGAPRASPTPPPELRVEAPEDRRPWTPLSTTVTVSGDAEAMDGVQPPLAYQARPAHEYRPWHEAWASPAVAEDKRDHAAMEEDGDAQEPGLGPGVAERRMSAYPTPVSTPLPPLEGEGATWNAAGMCCEGREDRESRIGSGAFDRPAPPFHNEVAQFQGAPTGSFHQPSFLYERLGTAAPAARDPVPATGADILYADAGSSSDEDRPAPPPPTASAYIRAAGAPPVPRLPNGRRAGPSSGRWPCPLAARHSCSRTYSSAQAADTHAAAAHLGARFPCGEAGCAQVFRRVEDAKRHRRAQHGGQVFRCGECGWVGRRKDRLKAHVKAGCRGAAAGNSEQRREGTHHEV